MKRIETVLEGGASEFHAVDEVSTWLEHCHLEISSINCLPLPSNAAILIILKNKSSAFRRIYQFLLTVLLQHAEFKQKYFTS
jgi:hypothetical protein